MNSLLTLRTITPLHVGTGQSVGTTDLPIAREKTTQWPVIPGSSVKGVLKDFKRVEFLAAKEGAVRGKEAGNEADAALAYLFGSPVNEDALAGALAITDLRCLLFPVRSLAGTFAYATCPLALRRANELIGITGGAEIPVGDLSKADSAWVTPSSSLVHGSGSAARVFLEDLDLTVEKGATDGPSGRLAQIFGLKPEVMARHLAVISDDLFSFLCTSATEVTTHVSLDFETRTARPGFLRSEERVPEEAGFIGLAMVDRLHKEARSAEVIRQLDSLDGKYLQFGGKASVGNGLCRVGVSR